MIIAIFKKKIISIKKNLNKLLILSLFSTLFILFSNINRPDAALYHLPYVSYLNEHKIIFGLNNIHFRFATSSIIQYLSAINFNFFFGINGISVPLSIFALTIIFYFWERIIFFIKTKNYNLEFYFILFSSIFIAYKMSRYSGYGNDNTTHLLYFFLISLLLNPIFNKNFDLICFIVVFIFLNKNTYVLTLVIPIIYFFKNKIYLDKFEIIKKIFSPYTFLLFFWCLKNIIISGCIIYPITDLCFSNLQWVENKKNIEQEAIAGEAWAKGWPQYEGKLNQNDFNKNFNWIDSWNKVHLKKIFSILYPYFFCLIILYFFILFSKDKKNFLQKNKDFTLIFLINLIFVLVFFLKFPLFRYGSSYIVSLLILLFMACIKNFNILMIQKLSKILLIVTIIAFNFKQLIKIYNNYDSVYINKPWPNIYSLDDNIIHKKEIFQNYKKLNIYFSNRECGYSKAICGNYVPTKKYIINSAYSYYIIKL